MNWLNKMERKFGKYAIKNLTIYLLVCYGIGYIISMVMPTLLTYFTLEPALILKGQVWRLVSWVIVPPTSRFIYVVFMMLCYYSLGQTLERIWGTFRYNLYMFSGMLFTIIGTFIAYGVVYVQYHAVVGGIGNVVSTYYINMSIFLACAAIMPDMQVLFWGLIPVKMKWFAILDIVFVGMDLIWGGTVTRIIIVASPGLSIILFEILNSPPGLYRQLIVSGILPIVCSRKSMCVISSKLIIAPSLSANKYSSAGVSLEENMISSPTEPIDWESNNSV